jgi:hypothetical protein
VDRDRLPSFSMCDARCASASAYLSFSFSFCCGEQRLRVGEAPRHLDEGAQRVSICTCVPVKQVN